jgi:hypothetical protein
MKSAQSTFDFVIVTTAATAVIAAWAWLAYLPFGGFSPKLVKLEPNQEPTTLAQLGTYGDMFGALTCVFTGLGFVGAGYAVVLQLRALRHQQEDMKRATRERDAAEEIRMHEKVIEDAWTHRSVMLNATNFLAQTYAAKLAALPAELINHADRKGLEETRKRRADLENKLNDLIELLTTMLIQAQQERTQALNSHSSTTKE